MAISSGVYAWARRAECTRAGSLTKGRSSSSLLSMELAGPWLPLSMACPLPLLLLGPAAARSGMSSSESMATSAVIVSECGGLCQGCVIERRMVVWEEEEDGTLTPNRSA